MPRTAVDSNVISHLDYDPQTETCILRFHNGGNRYAYSPMSEAEYKSFLAGEGFTPPSVGRHFSTHIRNNPRYKVVPLGPEPGQEDDTKEVAVA